MKESQHQPLETAMTCTRRLCKVIFVATHAAVVSNTLIFSQFQPKAELIAQEFCRRCNKDSLVLLGQDFATASTKVFKDPVEESMGGGT